MPARLPRPGAKGGPCTPLGEAVDRNGDAVCCKHPQCISTRALAESACRVCARPIGYDVPYHALPDRQGYVHSRCWKR